MYLMKHNLALPPLFNDFFGTTPPGHYQRPAVNVQELEDSFVLEVAAPGVKKQDFSIELEQQILTIKTAENTSTDATPFSLQEFNSNGFQRSFELPDSVNTEKIKAKHTDGVLTIVLPKQEAALTQPVKKIAIG